MVSIKILQGNLKLLPHCEKINLLINSYSGESMNNRIGEGNRNFNGPFGVNRKVPKNPLRGQMKRDFKQDFCYGYFHFREAIPSDHGYHFLIHDRDCLFSSQLDQSITHMRR